MNKAFLLFVVFFLCFSNLSAWAEEFSFTDPAAKVEIVYAKNDRKLSQIAANLLADDIEMVVGYRPKVSTELAQAAGNVILIGTIESPLLKSVDKKYFGDLENKWECYAYKLIKDFDAKVKNMLIVAGSDIRGTAFGVFEISRKIGVDPWYWWADVHPKKQANLSIEITDFRSESPSVQYRGIFINDEDWGLQPWAAKTFEPETKDIGPKTYAKVFELLLRLKANLIWPAMHPSTKAFYYYPENKQIAADYEIVLGTSHAEPMLRNNVDEWDKKEYGDFNYLTNKQKVLDYWESRVKESKVNEVIYTMGMRGVHDGKMEGVKNTREAVPVLETILKDQQHLLEKHVDAKSIPKALTVYKEVLDIYEAGLAVPEEITLVWPDDNYGYIHRLANPQEAARKGGTGVYYHASYWGRPHDYLWISSTHPALIREEMSKAYTMQARKIWVLNVGDIKPAEYDTQLFLDMAYDIKPFLNADYTKEHMYQWAAANFGKEHAGEIRDLMWQYYDLAFERRPEFMGWSQTEPTTEVKLTDYKHTLYGDEAQKRIDRYETLERQTKILETKIDPSRRDAFYQLVYYPVKGASLMNKKYLYRDKALLYAKQGRQSAMVYKELSMTNHEEIIRETDYYNQVLAKGKWKGIMSMQPRNLPVFKAPEFDLAKTETSQIFGVSPEGSSDGLAFKMGSKELKLPLFRRNLTQKYFIDVFLCKEERASVKVMASDRWLRVSQSSIKLSPDGLKSEQRIWVEIDWSKVPKYDQFKGYITLKGKSASYVVQVNAINENFSGFEGAMEADGYIAIRADEYNRQVNRKNGKYWQKTQAMGRSGDMLEAMPFTAKADTSESKIVENPYLEYEFYNFTALPAEIYIYTLPTFPLHDDYEMRYAVQVDDLPLKVVNFKTVGRTNEWKNNVLRNAAIKSVSTSELKPGSHRLRIYMVDPGVILDKMFISLGKRTLPYGDLEE